MTALTAQAAHAFAFGPFVLLPEQQQLLKGDEVIRMGGRALDLLTALVERPGQVIPKAELVAIAWPRLVVEEGNLKVNIFAIRKLLGDAAHPPRYIETVAGTGYRFIGEVQTICRRPAQRASLPATGAVPVGHLPPLPGQVYGRDDTIRAVLLDLQRSRLVSIVGPGGIGKTTVALSVAVAGAVAGAFPGGVRFVDLAAVDDPARVHHVLHEALRGGIDASGVRPPVAPAGPDRDTLVILDNCEPLIEAVATCADQLLRSVRPLRLMATSREPLAIRGEVVRRLPGLALGHGPPTLSAARALQCPAVQLFVARASEAGDGFELDDRNASLVMALCQQLDGHALAIERVARRVPALGLPGMLDHIRRRLHMLDGDVQGPERHRTLFANVAASYALLSGEEQDLLRRLARLDGPFTLATACALVEQDAADPGAVAERVAQLVAKSLLQAEFQQGDIRYDLLHITRAFLLNPLLGTEELTPAPHWDVT